MACAISQTSINQRNLSHLDKFEKRRNMNIKFQAHQELAIVFFQNNC
jgi:hypothetical protein